MKKLVLSALAVVAYVTYAIFQRETGALTTPSGGDDANTPTVRRVGDVEYRNGEYTGDVANTSWGDIQVQVEIDNNSILSVSVSEYPRDRPLSTKINDTAVPILEQEAVQVQSAEVNLVTGATVTSEGFIGSLRDALAQAGG